MEAEAERAAEQFVQRGANATGEILQGPPTTGLVAQPYLQRSPDGRTSAPGPHLIQRQVKKKTTYVPYQIYVTERMTPEEFKAAAMRQIFGEVPKNAEWLNLKEVYVPENSPYTVQVDSEFLKQQRGQARRERGISV